MEKTNNQKFCDHCHSTGKYGGAPHSICNLIVNLPNKIPAVFYNGSNYDYHFVIKELACEFTRKLFLFQYQRKLQILRKIVRRVF